MKKNKIFLISLLVIGGLVFLFFHQRSICREKVEYQTIMALKKICTDDTYKDNEKCSKFTIKDFENQRIYFLAKNPNHPVSNLWHLYQDELRQCW